MTKIMISQPMNGRTDDEILAVRDRIAAELTKKMDMKLSTHSSMKLRTSTVMLTCLSIILAPPCVRCPNAMQYILLVVGNMLEDVVLSMKWPGFTVSN